MPGNLIPIRAWLRCAVVWYVTNVTTAPARILRSRMCDHPYIYTHIFSVRQWLLNAVALAHFDSFCLSFYICRTLVLMSLVKSWIRSPKLITSNYFLLYFLAVIFSSKSTLLVFIMQFENTLSKYRKKEHYNDTTSLLATCFILFYPTQLGSPLEKKTFTWINDITLTLHTL